MASSSTDVSRINSEFRKSAGKIGIITKEPVADKVKISDQRDIAAKIGEPFADLRHGLSCRGVVHCDPDDLAASFGEQFHLGNGLIDICGISVGHRLDHDRVAATNQHAAHVHRMSVVSRRQFACSGIFRFTISLQNNSTCQLLKQRITLNKRDASPPADQPRSITVSSLRTADLTDLYRLPK